MKVLTTVSNEPEAYMLVNALKEEGIDAFLNNEGTSDIFGGLTFADIPVTVEDKDYPRALAFLNAYNKNLESNSGE